MKLYIYARMSYNGEMRVEATNTEGMEDRGWLLLETREIDTPDVETAEIRERYNDALAIEAFNIRQEATMRAEEVLAKQVEI